MGELLIGTSGYNYPEWKGGFYPEKLAQTKFLSYYSTQFNSVELNGTWYKMPTPQQMNNMITRSDGKIKFTVKAFKGITHDRETSLYQSHIYLFKKALEPLIKEKLLLCVLFQFPESYHYDIEERKYLDMVLKEVTDIPVVVEMRNTKWQNENVYNELIQRKIGWCITDNPNLQNTMKLEYKTTSDIAYMRFHGRNAKMWYTGDNATKFDYLYSEDELKEFIDPIKLLLQQTKIVQLFFNNHAKSQAAINAKKIELLLKEYIESNN